MSTDGTIRLLPDVVASKIAAGEVVERPASVVKELMENSIDAGATQIDVEIVAGGRRLVAIRDNGSGMTRDNALLAIERHATSKIRDVDDIECVATLGFRGEALAAIASVSRFRLVTCREGELGGTELLVVAGKIQDVREFGCPAGTAIEVRDLFFNVPARRKFMRAFQTELTHVRDTFLVQALAHPEIGMSLVVDGRETYRLPGGAAFADRIRDLFGAPYLKALLSVNHTQAGMAVSGMVTPPDVTRADRNETYVFVNGRAATAPLVGYAIKEAYRGLLPRERHPSVFLFLKLPPDGVDVNVHPTKREVRFRRTSDVRDVLVTALRKALRARGASAETPDAATDPERTVLTEPDRPVAHVQLDIDNLPPTRSFRYPRLTAGDENAAATGNHAPPPAGRQGTTARPAIAPPRAAADEDDGAPAGMESPWSWCRVLGQVGGFYVVMETEDGVVIMDPRAAHERVLYERYVSSVAAGTVASQNLLLPQTVELRPKDAAAVRASLSVLAALGFGVSEFGGDAFVVDALPACFAEADPERLLVELCHDLELAGTRGAHERWREEAIAQAASRAAVRAYDRLSLEAIEQLVVDLAKAEMPYTSPRGRPTLMFTPFAELNKKFGR